MSKAVLAWLGILFIAMGGTIIWLGIKYSRPAVQVYAPVPQIDRDYKRPPPSAGDAYLTEFTLTERSGKRLGTADLAGRVSVTNFFFSSCPSTCLAQNRAFETVQREYGPQGVQFVSITCDPEIDTPSVLQAYTKKHQFEIAKEGDAWWFLTGDLTYIKRIAEEYYSVPLKRWTHTEKFEVRDKWGNPRGSFSWQNSVSLAELKLMLDKLLDETEPPADVQAAAVERAAMLERAKANAPAAAPVAPDTTEAP